MTRFALVARGAGLARRHARADWGKAWRCQAFEHQADHGEPHEGGDGFCVALEVARQLSIAADPGEGPLDDLSVRQGRETMEMGSA